MRYIASFLGIVPTITFTLRDFLDEHDESRRLQFAILLLIENKVIRDKNGNDPLYAALHFIALRIFQCSPIFDGDPGAIANFLISNKVRCYSKFAAQNALHFTITDPVTITKQSISLVKI